MKMSRMYYNFVIDFYGGRCACCDASPEKDHIRLKIWHNDLNVHNEDIDNLTPLCPRCFEMAMESLSTSDKFKIIKKKFKMKPEADGLKSLDNCRSV